MSCTVSAEAVAEHEQAGGFGCPLCGCAPDAHPSEKDFEWNEPYE